VIERLRRARAEFLGLNRRNHGYLFAYNPRRRYTLVDDKVATKQALIARGVPTPGLLARCDAPWEVRDLRRRLMDADGFVLKPARGSGGGGILVIVEQRPPLWTKASGQGLTWPAVVAHAVDVIGGTFSPGSLEDVLLAEELVVPEPTLARLSYRGVPDLRVLVFRGVPVLAMLRLATRRSDGRANLHLGGVGVGVALDTGRTTHGVLRGRPVDVHPDLGGSLAGTALPQWERALELAVRAADAVGLGFLGVDVVFDARRGPLVLEMNARPGLAIQLANRRGLRPLLDAISAASVPPDPVARVALGVDLSRAGLAPRLVPAGGVGA
jgi:alpha-L-glutamate ligase-like protein